MKKYLYVVLLSSAAFSALGQDPEGYCGTPHLSELQESFLDDFHAGLYDGLERGGLTYIPVQVHIVGTDNGTGYYRTTELFTAFCELNQHFAPVDFYFYIAGDINYINKTTYFNHDWQGGSQMMANNNVDDVVNMYFVGDANGNCGYFSPFGDAVVIAKGCAQSGETTIAHELGHYFSLPHTFNGWEDGTPPASQQELADGSNCAFTGDEFCDTPADYVAYRWTCPWGGTLIDPQGDTVVPDGSFYMSYSNDECTNRFSTDQMQAMNAFLAQWRPELLGNNPPAYVDLDPVELLSPAHQSSGMNADWVELHWKPVAGATKYGVQVSRFAAFTLLALDAVVNDTVAVVTGLQQGITYRWRVVPLMETNTCEDHTVPWEFVPGAPTGLAPTFEHGLGTLFPNPVAAGSLFTLSFDSASDRLLEVLDVRGRLLESQALAQEQIGITLDHPGIYYIVVESGSARTTHQVVVTP